MSEFKLNTAGIYLTERCPLACSYCYFRDKRERSVSWEMIGRFVDMVEHEWMRPRSFLLSGGEPLLEWNNVKRLVLLLHARFPGVPVSMQTNGLLLNAQKIKFLQMRQIGLEFGIDGAFETTSRWRKPINRKMFDQLVRNIGLAVESGMHPGCTMTVHPDEVELLVDNLRFIQRTGMTCVDITPAAFMPWNRERIAAFKAAYIKILEEKDLRSLLFMGEDHELLVKGTVDVSLHPPGHVLLGDAFLCLPESARKKFSLWNARTGQLRPVLVDYYAQLYTELWKRPSWRTYRDHIIFNFEVVNRMLGREYLNVQELRPLMRFLTTVHLSYRHG